MHHYLSIGDFARSAGLSVSAVRFYSDRGLLPPAHVDSSSGYRSFSPSQVAAGCLIRDLRQIDLALCDIEDALLMDQPALEELIAHHVEQLEGRVDQARAVLGALASPTRSGKGQNHASESSSTVVRGADLCAAIDQVLPFVTTDLELPHLLTVRIEAKDGSVRLAATDTFRLAVRDVVSLQVGPDFTGVVAAATLATIRMQLEPTGEVSLLVDDGETALSLEHATGVAEARLLPATFPDYERFLTPREHVSTLVVSKAELVDALETFASESQVRLASSDTNLVLTGGDLTVPLHADGDADPAVTTVVNPALSLDCARGAIGAEIAIEIHADPLEPVVFRSATDGTYTSFLMPIKVDSPDQ